MQTFYQKLINRVYLGVTRLCLIGLLCVACTAPTQRNTPPLPTASPPPAFVAEVTGETLPILIIAERDASIQGNLPLLAILWAESSRIVDGRESVEESDDYVWAGRAAILDRYQIAVFPAPPPSLSLPELANAIITVNGESATLINQGDRWRFVQQDGRWWLQELVYSAPSPSQP